MDDPGTDALRKLAPSWTLAGDEQLLSILQNTHQRLVSKCQEANSQLEQMATALNDASISLQNVNNQFMALSSSQFIESRVYDDDDLATDVPAVKEPPKPEIPDELTSLKRSISVLENAHEIITILQDSDTESDTDDEMPARMVLKPKDMYANRPLPYIIGSQPWKSKWHAGLVLEDSDSDSSASKVEHDSEQYSQSEPEDTHTDKLPLPIHTQSTVSETSSELPSEQGSVPKPTPSDVASEIARRLGAREPVKMVEREPEEEEPPKPIVRKIYRPQDPISTTVFPDEPPPLSDQSDSDSDIFATLHRSQPQASTRYENSHAVDQLFPDQGHSDHADIFSDFANKPASNSTANSTSIFDAGPEPNMFVKHADSRHTADRHRKHIQEEDHRRQRYDHDDSREEYEERGDGDDFRGRGGEEAERGVKKPIGGISLFGNKGTESIGAAILKRNQRKSSTSGDESGSDSRSESQPNQQIRTEKDIFDDLFARSESQKVSKEKDFTKDLKKEIKKKAEVKEKKIEKPKVDLFSDNLFDDIDDIFSTNVVKMPAKDTAKSKSIFEDDDDLFAEIAAPKPMKVEVASSSNKKNKSLFDSDDELFSENTPVNKPKETPKTVEINKPKIAERTEVNESSNVKKETTKSIFDDDEDDLFSDLKTNEISTVQNNVKVNVENSRDFAKEDKTKNLAPSTKNIFRSPSLFDEDDDESDLFAEPAKSSNNKNVITVPIKETKVSSQNSDKTPRKTGSQTHEETSTKLSSQIIEEISKKPSSKTDEQMFTKPSSQTEVKIPEEIVYATPTSPVKTDENEEAIVANKNIDVNKDSNKTDKIVNTSETEKKIFENEDSVLPVSKNVDSKKENLETNAARIFDHIKNIEESSSDTNNDFSDQDFDDLPPKEETNKTVVNDSNKIAEKHKIFDKVTLEEDIDELFVTSQQNTAKTETKFNTIPDFTEPITEKTETDNKKEEISPKTIEADIFTNIVTEPPVFEKPKEPKKSKNVNALFDDDSDDESLFFKKNDPIFVEHPAEFTPTQDRIFGLFTDEPPDDGFSKISDDFDDDMFSTVPKPKIPHHEPPTPNAINFEGSNSTNNKIPDIEKLEPVEEINNDLRKDQAKTAIEITKEPRLDVEEDIFKLPTEENIDKGQNSSSALSEDEQLFKIPTKESKPVLKEKPSLDFLSDDDNLFASKPKEDKPTKLTPKPVPAPQSKNIASKDKPTADLFSDEENLFAPKTILEKPSLESTKESKPESKSLASEEKPSLDIAFDDENLFASKPVLEKPPSLIQEKSVPTNAKATLREKPGLDIISDEETLFESKPQIEKSTMEQEKPVPENIKPTLKEKPSLDFLSDDENLFTPKPKLEKPLVVSGKPVPENTKPILKEKPSLDFLSDDENLFTSKPTLEKPPMVQTVPRNEDITTKTKLASNLSSDDENLFASVPTLEKPIKQEKPVLDNKNLESVSKSSDDELFSSLEKTETPKLSENKLILQDSKSDEDLFKTPVKPEFVPKPSESKPEKSEKKVGKLKVGLNINVNALLPGASPKKVKPKDQPDGQSQSVVESQSSEPQIHSEVRRPEPKIHSDVRKPEPEIPSQNTDSKLLKSVSFDGKPESDVLDNKLSKERAKIQVKRRPSTRRARREAVRKSGIDFGDDSTDNSSSIDDPPRKHPEVSKEVAKANDITPKIHLETPEVQAKVDDTAVQAKTDPIILEKDAKVETEPIVVEKPPQIEPEVTDKPTYSRDVKSKVVYILNDEDIFNTSPVENISENITKNLISNIGVSTLGKAYPEKSSKNDAKSTLFDDENDEEMFKPKKEIKKSTIFDSDSEEDLFGTTSKKEERKVEKVEVKKEIKREVVKGSLFGDEDEDDDLFGVKTKKIVDQKSHPSRATVKETPKSAEPVFEDPLSMFGDDD